MDARSGVRGLLRSPGTTAAALLALALGIGANTAVFSVARATLARPLPYSDPDRLVAVFQRLPSLDRGSPVTLRIFEEWRRRKGSFEDLASLSDNRSNLTSPGRPALLPQAWVSANFFDLSGAKMAAGRSFREDELRRRDRVAVISHALYTDRYGGDPARLGQGIVLDGLRYAVVGVAPPGFSLFGDFEVWLPDIFRPDLGDSGWHFLWVLGRLRSGAGLEQADRECEAVSRALAVSEPEVYAGRTVDVQPLRSVGQLELRRTLAVLGLFVSFVLLISCADVAGLLLARATGREGEIALRVALGADRRRLVRWMLAESLALFLAGGLIALPLAFWGTRLLARLGPDNLTLPDPGPHPGALLFALGLSLATGLLFGLLPALMVTGRLAETLKDARRVAGRPGSQAVRRLLVAGQVALTVVLVAGALLLLRSFNRLRGVDPGFRPHGVLAVLVQPPLDRYSEPGARVALYRRTLDLARKVPGAEAAALQNALPFMPNPAVQFTVEGVPNPPPGQNRMVSARCVSPGYFEMMGIHRVSGRPFADTDILGSPPVAIINETMADHYWPGQNPVGKRFGFGYPEPFQWMTVVGVVRNTRQRSLLLGSLLEVYCPLFQEPDDSAYLSLRVPGDPLAWAPAIRKALRQADPGLAGGTPVALETVIPAEVAASRFKSLLSILFAALALLLAAVGIYGVISYSVARRTHEMGIRIALGAQPGDVLRRVVLEGMIPVLAGLAVGLVAARLLGGLLADQLYEVTSGDPLTFVVTALVIVITGLVATYFPAYRATQVDPLAALRED